MKKRYWVAAGSVAAATVAVSLLTGLPKTSLLDAALPTASAHATGWQSFAQLPIAFERNQGQTDAQVAFLARGPGYGLFLTPTEAVLSLQAVKAGSDPAHPAKLLPPTVVRMSLLGASRQPAIEGEGLQPGVSNYFQGASQEKWQRGVARYDKVRYRDVYPGVDLVYYGKQQQLEYDFIVAPGRDPNQIAMDFSGIDSVGLDTAGNLILKTPHGDLMQHKPVVYQQVAGQRRPVEGRYRLIGGNRIGFEIGRYDAAQPLIIDPVMGYTSYFGGGGDDSISTLRVDEAGNLYAIGTTVSVNFPLKNAAQGTNRGGSDVFVSKFNTDGNALLFSSYLGGGGVDIGVDAQTGANGAIYLTGQTTSTNFPVSSAVQTAHAADGGLEDAFVAGFNASGNLVFSTYLGGNQADYGLAIGLDRSGNVYVGGATASSNYPTASALDSTLDGAKDGFLTKLNASGSSITYSTYLGGGGADQINALVVDAVPTHPGAVYLTGSTDSTNFPVNSAHAVQTSRAGGSDAFVTVLEPSASAPFVTLGFSSYLGSANEDAAFDIAIDDDDDAFVVGRTLGSSAAPFPVFSAAQGGSAGGADGFVTKIDLQGTGNAALLFSTYIGGGADDEVREVEVDPRGSAYVVGSTKSTDLRGPWSAYGLQHTSGGGSDAFVARYASIGELFWATYLGGSGDDFGYSIALYGPGNIFVGGATASTNLPTHLPFQTAKAAGSDGFVARYGVRSARTNTHNFDGDRTDDIFWQNSATGAQEIWRAAKSTTKQAVTKQGNAAWKVVGVGDFDGDFRSDVLWRNRDTGANSIWRSAIAATSVPVTSVTNFDWQVAGVGDFDADSKSDILWRNGRTGANTIWLSGNSATPRSVAAANTAWKVVGVGDFNNDYYFDILWRNPSTGANVIWLSGDSATQQTVMGVTNQSWVVAGIGDFLGDGKSDILWRNTTTGANVIWRGGAYTSQQSMPAVNLSWSVSAIGDYNADGRSDILWRNASNGANTIWRSGSAANQQSVTRVENLAWKVVP